MFINDMIEEMANEKEALFIKNIKKTNTLLYADDITILARSMGDLQKILGRFETYCAK